MDLDFHEPLLTPSDVLEHLYCGRFTYFERHLMPRPKVHWDPMAAVVSYDGQLATSGITTVLDSVRIWREAGIQEVDGQHDVLSDAIAAAADSATLAAVDLSAGWP